MTTQQKGPVDFVEWLEKQLLLRSMSQAELARRSGVARQTISKYLSHRTVRYDAATLHQLAKGLSLHPDEIYRAAGLMPDPTNRTEQEDQLLRRWRKLTNAQLNEITHFVDYVLWRDNQYQHQSINDEQPPYGPK